MAIVSTRWWVHPATKRLRAGLEIIPTRFCACFFRQLISTSAVRTQSGHFLRSHPVHRQIKMAEIFGVVASGLAVAEVGLKVGGTVWKLKRLWQEVHGVPETIQDLMRQIEMMDPILSDHETNLGIQSTASLRQRPNHSSAPAMLSAVYCREALNDLRCLVKDLDVAVASEKRRKRAVARMKVVLKKDTIKGFQDRLERAMRLLQSTQMSNLVLVIALNPRLRDQPYTYEYPEPTPKSLEPWSQRCGPQ